MLPIEKGIVLGILIVFVVFVGTCSLVVHEINEVGLKGITEQIWEGKK